MATSTQQSEDTLKIEITELAAKQIKKLGRVDAARVSDYLRNRVATLGDRKQLGDPLRSSELGSFWRYRVGDIRILCEFPADPLMVRVIVVGRRGSVYRDQRRRRR